MRLPIGVQDFTHLREEGYLYVDKTMFLPPFLEGGRFFLARPRRFGKSLLLSTLKAAFSGRKDLFAGLWLEHNHDFAVHPIIRLDFSVIEFEKRSLELSLIESFRRTAREYGLELQQDTAKSVFEELILALSAFGKVVVLIDEYDKPITDFLLEPDKRAEHQATLKRVYGVLKPMDAYLHLVLLTGVSKIGKLSLFSDLNNLQDISLNAKYATLCGYTKKEIEQTFQPYLESLRVAFNTTSEILMRQIALWYNGYSWDGINKLYCPFGFLIFLEQQEFKSFWYETAIPTFLLQLIRDAQINPLEFYNTQLDSSAISSTNVEQIDPISLMFQTGYLTIQDVAKSMNGTSYTLAYPNQEVRQAFSTNLLLEYSQMYPSRLSGFSLRLSAALLILDWETVFEICNQIFSTVPYEIFPKYESYIHSLMHLMLTCTGLTTQSQVQTSLGRMDTLVATPNHSIIFEFKTKGTPKEALAQINTNRYADALVGLPKAVIKVGVVFNLEQECVGGWAVEST
jgi:hypothetical protein